MSTPIPLEDALAVLSRAAATETSAPDATDLHLRAARVLDVLSSRGIDVPAERLVPLLAGAAEDASQSLLDLLVGMVRESEGVAAAVIDRARAVMTVAARSVSAEAASAHAARKVLLDPAVEIGRYLPRSVALQNEFRREELVRAWAGMIGAPIEHKRKVETEDRSRRALERLDYRKIKADEERLTIERRVLAEHAEKVREKQRREAEALANAQRE